VTRWGNRPPDRIPEVGAVLDLPVGDVRYRSAPLRLLVKCPRPDISLWYDGQWIWLEGAELDVVPQHDDAQATNHTSQRTPVLSRADVAVPLGGWGRERLAISLFVVRGTSMMSP
jgi:hypothetical protein